MAPPFGGSADGEAAWNPAGYLKRKKEALFYQTENGPLQSVFGQLLNPSNSRLGLEKGV